MMVYSAIVHLGAAVPARPLRCVLNCTDMVTVQIARFDAPFANGGLLPPDKPGLGIEIDRSALGIPNSVRGA